MKYRIELPAGGRAAHLDILDPFTTTIQRQIRRQGLAGFEPYTSAALLSLFEGADPGFVFYDVGANIGIYSALAATMYRPRIVHAFEPMPSTAEIMRRVVAANRARVVVHQAALSDKNGTSALYLSPVSDASNSMVPGFREATGEIEVPTRRLDDCVVESGDVPDFVKIDVETFEPAVLAGATETIVRHRPTIVVEVLYRRSLDLGERIHALLDGLDYSYYPLTANFDGTAHERIKGQRGSDRDWILAPVPLDATFVDRWNVWKGRIENCTADHNPHPPIIESARRALDRGGARELFAMSKRQLGAWAGRNAKRGS